MGCVLLYVPVQKTIISVLDDWSLDYTVVCSDIYISVLYEATRFVPASSVEFDGNWKALDYERTSYVLVEWQDGRYVYGRGKRL